MAMSDTGSSFAQWAGLYHHEPISGPSLRGLTAESTVVTSAAATTAATSPTSAGSAGGGSPARNVGGIEGHRVGGKTAGRKRSRASRRAPVTLLNTDTANFRAMVQQFTGIPNPSPLAGSGGVPVINFAADYGFRQHAAVMPFDHLHHQQRQPPFQDQLLRRPQHQHQYTGAAFGYSSSSMQGVHGGDMFAHGLDTAEDRMLLQSMQAAQMPAATANHSANGYFT